MKLVLGQIAEVVGPMATEGIVAAMAVVVTVVVGVAARVVAGSKDISQLGDPTSY